MFMLPKIYALLSAAMALGAGTVWAVAGNAKTMQVSGFVTSGTGSVTVALEGSMDGAIWTPVGSVTLALGTAVASTALQDAGSRYPQYRANVTDISGTGARVTAVLGA